MCICAHGHADARHLDGKQRTRPSIREQIIWLAGKRHVCMCMCMCMCMLSCATHNEITSTHSRTRGPSLSPLRTSLLPREATARRPPRKLPLELGCAPSVRHRLKRAHQGASNESKLTDSCESGSLACACLQCRPSPQTDPPFASRRAPHVLLTPRAALLHLSSDHLSRLASWPSRPPAPYLSDPDSARRRCGELQLR